ncbi:MAG: endolytic transglycosylase MltG, partial [Succinivibrio dextrinosolvens]|nr:endolytic transglycosylase MltG [Succinivibrio dextrinosolvens]
MTKSKKILAGFFAFILFSLSAVSFFAYSTIEKLNNSELSSKTETYELKKGATVKTVINDLLDNSWDRLVAKFYLRFSTPYSSIQKGEYLIGPNKSFISILKDMSEGNVIVKTYPTFTIVEGMNLSKIIKKAERFKNKLSDDKFFSSLAKEDVFLRKLLKDQEDLLDFIGEDVTSLEGLISPATYPLYEKDPFYTIFRQGIVSQLKSLKTEWDNRDESNNIKTPYEALILASLIERETFLD